MSTKPKTVEGIIWGINEGIKLYERA